MPRKKIRLTPETITNPDEQRASAISSTPEVIEPFAEQANVESRSRTTKTRLSIPFDEHGSVDTQSCSQNTVTKLRAILNDQKLREQLGLASIPPEIVFSEEDVSMILDLMGGIEGQIFAWVGKVDPDIAIKYAIWQPNEKAVIMKPAQAVLAKNVASLAWFLRWRDEIALGLLMVTITRAKYQGAKMEMQLRREGKIPPMAQPGVQPPVKPEQPTDGQQFVAEGEKIVQ